MGEMRNAYKILVGKPESKRSLGIHRCRLEDNIRMDLREIVFSGVDWIHMSQDRGTAVAGSCVHVMNLQV
jgi:hypothetical protein